MRVGLDQILAALGALGMGEMISSTANGVVISVRVIPRANRSVVDGIRGNALLVRLKAPPVEGAANAELIRVVADVLGVAIRSVTIVGGGKARQKRVAVEGVSLAQAKERLTRSDSD
jgi:uncharacterized protein (TIGR00251 family)